MQCLGVPVPSESRRCSQRDGRTRLTDVMSLHNLRLLAEPRRRAACRPAPPCWQGWRSLHNPTCAPCPPPDYIRKCRLALGAAPDSDDSDVEQGAAEANAAEEDSDDPEVRARCALLVSEQCAYALHLPANQPLSWCL